MHLLPAKNRQKELAYIYILEFQSLITLTYKGSQL